MLDFSKGVSSSYTEVTKDRYKVEHLSKFYITAGFTKSFSSITLFFHNELTRHTQNKLSSRKMFVNDILLIKEINRD